MLRKKQLALDTNLPLDLAQQEGFAFDFKEVVEENGYSLFIGPTARRELWLKSQSENREEAALSSTALQNTRAWGITPFEVTGREQDIAGQCARRLIRAGYLPQDEFNDGVILAETAFADIPVLITSDHHLLDIDLHFLHAIFNTDFQIPLVTPIHPNDFLRALLG